MSRFVLPSIGVFPAGAEVEVFPEPCEPAQRPVATDSVASDGTVTFVGLNPASLYTARSTVAGQELAITFATDGGPASPLMNGQVPG